jgi:hypothetical protein
MRKVQCQEERKDARCFCGDAGGRMTTDRATEVEFDNSAVVDDGALYIFDVDRVQQATGAVAVVVLEGSVYLVMNDYRLRVLELAKEPFKLPARTAKVRELKPE